MKLHFPHLPILPFLPQIAADLAKHKRLILQAEPGAGKTTVVPPYLLQQDWLGGKNVVMLEPRRLAAAAAAGRIAELLNEPLGQTAGYSVHLERCVSQETRIECVTEALFVRRIQADPGLKKIGLVILDEFHERSLYSDLALALILDICELNSDLHLLLMSATLETESLSRFLSAPVISVPGKAFPVETLYVPPEQGLLTVTSSAAAEPGSFNLKAFMKGLRLAITRSTGDILAFLPGAREIHAVREELKAEQIAYDIYILHGMISLEEQRRVISPHAENRGRLILATNLAESSLTVPGVRTVVDSGLARQAHFQPASGMNRLVTERISAHSAEQRRGRAGRIGPGFCIRVWDANEKLQSHSQPAILRSELSGLVLEAALWGAKDVSGLQLLTPPPAAMWQAGRELLFALGALDGEGSPTERGRKLSNLGLDTRLAALVLTGEERGLIVLAAGCAALLSDRDASPMQDEADFTLRLEELAAVLNETSDLSLARRYNRAKREFWHLLEQIGRKNQIRKELANRQISMPVTQTGALLLSVYPDRLAGFVSPGFFQLVSGRMLRVKGRLATVSFLVVPEAEAGSATGSAFLAATVTLPDIYQSLAHLLTEQDELSWQQLKYAARRTVTLGKLTLSSQTILKPNPQVVASSFCQYIRSKGLSLLPWSRSSESFLQRVRYASRTDCLAELPDFSEAALLAGLEQWLVPFLNPETNVVLDEQRLLSALQERLPYELKKRFNDQAPEFFISPAGSRHPVRYDENDAYVEVRIQELFGLLSSPIICRRPLVFRLLSPASRPLQITRDLAGFWKHTYPEIRAQMKIRYPKHYWPEDPFAAKPTTKTKPR